MSRQTSKQQRQVTEQLTNFADSLKATVTNGKVDVERVFKLLEQDKRFSVDRKYYGGSVGKNTSVINPDFDCVVFLNHVEFPLTSVLEDLETTLRENARILKINPYSIKRTWLTVTCRFTSGVELDLLPACSFAIQPDKQYEAVLRKLRDEQPDNRLLYSSSLAQMQIGFLSIPSSLTKQLIRLGKYWFKSLSLDGYVYGGSSIIEIICKVVIEEEPNLPSILTAFQKFIEKMVEVDNLRIAFIWDWGNTRWARVNPWDMYKYQNHFDQKIVSKNNYIIEPANPYNNLLENIDEKSIDQIKMFARQTALRLECLKATRSNEMMLVNPLGEIFIKFDKVFEPYPMTLREVYNQNGIPSCILVDYKHQHLAGSMKEKEINNEPLFQRNKEAEKVADTIYNNLLFLIRAKAANRYRSNAFQNGVAKVVGEDVRDAVEYFVTNNFELSRIVRESSNDNEHGKCDVNFYIPFINIRGYSLRISLKWQGGVGEWCRIL